MLPWIQASSKLFFVDWKSVAPTSVSQKNVQTAFSQTFQELQIVCWLLLWPATLDNLSCVIIPTESFWTDGKFLSQSEKYSTSCRTELGQVALKRTVCVLGLMFSRNHLDLRVEAHNERSRFRMQYDWFNKNLAFQVQNLSVPVSLLNKVGTKSSLKPTRWRKLAATVRLILNFVNVCVHKVIIFGIQNSFSSGGNSNFSELGDFKIVFQHFVETEFIYALEEETDESEIMWCLSPVEPTNRNFVRSPILLIFAVEATTVFGCFIIDCWN